MKYDPHPYQELAAEFILQHERCNLFLDMGLGKTVTTLTVLDELMNDRFEIARGSVLVIAPLRVAEDTWSREVEKWDHLRHLNISKILGTPKRRLEALKTPADFYIINRENVPWLVEQYRLEEWPFSTLVIDELSSFKNPQSKRFKALKRLVPSLDRFIGLTGTPAPRNLMDLWPELYFIDRGERLGKTLGSFRERYFRPGRRNGYTVFDWELKPYAEQEIYSKIQDVCMSLTASDWLSLPEKICIDHEVCLPEKVYEEYRRFEKEHFLALQDPEKPLLASNAGALCGKLTQYSNGAVYHEDMTWEEVHAGKLDMLEELVEEANGQSVLIFYSFQHDLIRIEQRLASYGPRLLQGVADIQDWNAGRIPVMLAHPASMGHGLNLQGGGHILIWFGIPWDLELYQQANARLYRQGQERSVLIHHIVCKNTIDEDILKRLGMKDMNQRGLIEAVKARMEGSV